ncbi:MAG TPA: hypothetical protein ENI77_06520 [Nitrospirae bacterium]|nr:hypothetical protein [Nitrospirota bacterium]
MIWPMRFKNKPNVAHRKEESETIRAPQPSGRGNIWAIGGGKGGIGKSLVTSSFGTLLARMGKRVLLVDADFGSANLHTFIKTRPNHSSFSNYLTTCDITEFDNLIAKTEIQNVDMISGSQDALDVADIKSDKIDNLYKALKTVEYDYILIDIGPGTSSVNLDIILQADVRILITTPEPTSVENSFRLLKAVYSHHLKKIMVSKEYASYRPALQSMFHSSIGRHDKKNINILKLMKDTFQKEGDDEKILKLNNAIHLVVNQAQRKEDLSLGPSMTKALWRHFGIKVVYLGCVKHDHAVIDSIRSRRPLSAYYENSAAAIAIEKSLQTLLMKLG